MKLTPWIRRVGPLAVVVATLAAAPASSTFTFKRGVNISHWLSQNNKRQPYGADWFTARDLDWIAAHGFDHIRLPVDGRLLVRPDGSLDEARLRPVDEAIRWARADGLGVILDMHFLPGADFNAEKRDNRVFTDMALQRQVAGFWRRLARRYADQGPWLRFEVLNEPVAAKNDQLNPFNARMLAAIRESNPTRVVYLTSNQWSSYRTVDDVVLPDDPNVAFTFHYYEPMVFTHQRASWAGFSRKMPPVQFPGRVPELTKAAFLPGHPRPSWVHAGEQLTVASIKANFDQVAAWARRHAKGREIYLGEFGVYEAAPRASCTRWIAAIRRAAESHGWSWAVWDYNSSFGVRGRDGRPTAVYRGLFPHRPEKSRTGGGAASQ